MALSMKMAVFRVVAPCSLSEVYRCFVVRVIIITLMMEEASTSETLVKLLPDYMVHQPRRQPSSSKY
jgi:hypothetical protein